MTSEIAVRGALNMLMQTLSNKEDNQRETITLGLGDPTLFPAFGPLELLKMLWVMLSNLLNSTLLPQQLGYSWPGGTELPIAFSIVAGRLNLSDSHYLKLLTIISLGFCLKLAKEEPVNFKALFGWIFKSTFHK